MDAEDLPTREQLYAPHPRFPWAPVLAGVLALCGILVVLVVVQTQTLSATNSTVSQIKQARVESCQETNARNRQALSYLQRLDRGGSTQVVEDFTHLIDLLVPVRDCATVNG
jgi:type VI protein secretion system component VasK